MTKNKKKIIIHREGVKREKSFADNINSTLKKKEKRDFAHFEFIVWKGRQE